MVGRDRRHDRIDQIEQSTFITNALLRRSRCSSIYGWRNNAGIYVDQQYFWWHSTAPCPSRDLALNFGRLQDPDIDGLLEQARSETDAGAPDGIAEDINRQFAKECWHDPV